MASIPLNGSPFRLVSGISIALSSLVSASGIWTAKWAVASPDVAGMIRFGQKVERVSVHKRDSEVGYRLHCLMSAKQ